MDFRKLANAFSTFFLMSQRERDARFNAFIELCEITVEKIPLKIRKSMKKIDPTITNDQSSWDWTEEDITWWKDKYNGDKYIVFRKIEDLRNEIYQALIDTVLRQAKLLGEDGTDLLGQFMKEVKDAYSE